MNTETQHETRQREHRGKEGTDLEEELMEAALRAREGVEDFVRREPHVALGLAAAAGFLLGGGMTPRRLVRLGIALGGPALTEKLAAHAAELVSEAMGREEHP